MVTLIVFATAAVLMMVLVVLAGTRMLRGRSSGAGAFAGGALGNFIDVFDPARSRAERDLESREHQGDVLPSPDEDDRAVAVDLDSRTARVRRDRAV